MAKRTELIFKIEGQTRETLPMAHLAEYMADLAALMGSPERVHFERLEDGSVCLVQSVEEEANAAVRSRVTSATHPYAADDVKRAYAALNFRLRDHNAVGRILERDTGAEIIRFPGIETPKPLEFGSISKQGSLDGELQAIGGRGDFVPVHIGSYTACRARRPLAKELAQHLFSSVRVYGQGRWKRGEDGKWALDHFVISSFEKLDQRSLTEALREIQSDGDNSWIEQGLADLQDSKNDKDD
jgi:hypothetical protein